ncbi:MAG TPA: ATP-binding protein [Steroidobacteraceae bacterium]|nr:ATP-binding protein [Steroidobacteraceae bacterium]
MSRLPLSPLHLTEQHFRAFLSSSTDVLYRMSADWTELRYLEGREFVPDTREPSRHWMENYVDPEDRARVRTAVDAAIRDRTVFDLEHRVIRADGTRGWTHSRAVPMLDAAGEVVEWIGVATDITASKVATDALAQQKRLYEAILTNTPDLAYVWNLDHRFIYANEGLLKMWGKTWEEAIGKHCLELGYEPWHAAMHDREIEQVKATKLPLRGEVPFAGTFGRRIYDYVLVPVIGEDGSVVAVAGTTRDVTDRKQMESSLVEADRRKDEFLATLAHELRNPLAPIRNAVHLLKVRDPKDETVRHARDLIDRQLQHLMRLVDDLLEVSRITLGQVTLRSELIGLRPVLEDALEVVAPSARSRGHSVRVEIPDDDLPLVGDPTRLSQVFQNLLDNAVKYTPENGEIVLRVARHEAEVEIRVCDNGIGIPLDVQSRIFDLFTRVHPSDRIKSSGLGIGLALARQLVKLHDGRLEVRSEGAGRGSEFVVTLPLASAPAAATATSRTAAELPAAGKRVLVVDDNRDAAESLAMILQFAGHEVITAFDGAQALDRVRGFRPDVVLMDIGMPGMDGYEVARRMRADPALRGLTLVAITGWGQAKDKDRALGAGFDRHLTKPVDPAELDSLLASPDR